MNNRARFAAVTTIGIPTLLDWSTVEGEIRARSTELHDRGDAFLEFVRESLFPGHEFIVTDGGNDRGVDAIALDDVDREIHVINSKCVRTHEKSTRNFSSGEVDKTLTFLDELIGKCESLESCNKELTKAVKEVWGRLEEGGYTLHLHLCSNQMPLVASESTRISLALRTKKIQLHEHHLRDLASGACLAVSPTARRLNFQSGNKFERLDATVRTVAGYVSLSELKSFLSGPDDQIDGSLFHGNVRAFLGSRTPVNGDIAATLNCERRDFFECMNNGIKVVCDSLITSVGSFPVNVVNPQIVNGLQTAHVCFQFASVNPILAETTMVLVQIAETKDRTRSAEIALASNNQQRIGTRDLRANDELQIKLERQLRKLGFSYIRKQAEQKRHHSAQSIDALRLGQIIAAYALGLPDKAKTQTQAIFDELYSSVFDPKFLSAERVVALHGLYSQIEQKRQFAKVIQRKLSSADYAEEWIIEGAFHVLYAIRLLMAANGLELFDLEKAGALIEEAISIVGSCFAKENTSAYRYFRLTATRGNIEEAVFSQRPVNLEVLGQMELPLV